MSKCRKRKVAATGPVWHLSVEEATLSQKPLYNAHICRTGPHGPVKYDRNRQKRSWRRELDEGARNHGLLPIMR